MNPLVASFLHAFRALEIEQDLQPLIELFAPECELRNPAIAGRFHGLNGARRFLRLYLDNFTRVRTEFRHVLANDDVIALEWRSTGFMRDGNLFEVNGVTILECSGTSITRLTAYFDPTMLDGAFASLPAA